MDATGRDVDATGLDGWLDVASELQHASGHSHAAPEENMQDRIVRVTADEKDLLTFFNISISKAREEALRSFYTDELDGLEALPFDKFDQEDKADYLLLKNYLGRNLRRLELESRRHARVIPFLPFAHALVAVCESRQAVSLADLVPQDIAQTLHDATGQVETVRAKVMSGELHQTKMAAHRAVRAVNELRGHLDELYSFFDGYVPLFDWWVSAPHTALRAALDALASTISAQLVGADDIIGDAIGEDGLRAELEAEMIPYTPQELMAVARRQFAWCEVEMKVAARELGFGEDCKAALEHVKNQYVPPGEQAALVKRLVDEGASFVKAHDLVTVPPLAERTWRMFMMTPEAQRANPFFLGGPAIMVSYPTPEMSHPAKLMSMRGNSPALSHATAFHEMVPGHRLQLFCAERYRPYRKLFDTPFYVEGWALYWELALWHRGDFFRTPEDRVGALFWRMHRCARIVFSLGFHLGRMTPRECVDLLVDAVGHERATAEGEVRRSLRGDYGPLYQAGYMLGALQLWALREEALSRGGYGEKAFHDRILRANTMPIEMLRALVMGRELDRDYKAKWKFAGDATGS